MKIHVYNLLGTKVPFPAEPLPNGDALHNGGAVEANQSMISMISLRLYHADRRFSINEIDRPFAKGCGLFFIPRPHIARLSPLYIHVTLYGLHAQSSYSCALCPDAANRLTSTTEFCRPAAPL